MRKLLITLCLLITGNLSAFSIKEFTQDFAKYQGFFDYYWDQGTGKIYLEINKFNQDFLYVNSLASGVGSNDLGLDRGQLGQEKVVNFRRVGPKVFLHQPNLNYRALSSNPLEVRAVQEAFASSILWGFKIVSESKGAVLVDVTDFLLRDSHNIAGRLSARKQGAYSADPSRSAIYLARTKNFPDNSEFEATITLKGKNPGRLIRSVTPSAEFVTVRTHHSFIRLPDDNYQPRAFDPRTGIFSISFKDYAAELGADMDKRYVVRHRLEKVNPNQAVSEVVEPIIYYLDPGVPEPVKTALLDGARWWAEAFEAAGFKNAYRVEMLPADADPMDVRYNTIQWVHRSTRGWSYGGSIVDPRTGEILKGHVTLGSLRVRQDMLIAQGLISPYGETDEVNEQIKAMALDRIRQLSAHEVGHTLGLAHNFAASTKNRASVMDYPHPLVSLNEQGKPVLTNAYDKGIGEWDKLSLAYAYAQFPKAQEQAGLASIIKAIADSGIPYITDQDSRRIGDAHPYASMWDNGSNAAAELERVLDVRAAALKNLGDASIQNGTVRSSLENLLVPIYLFHRYQAEAAGKLIGGVDFDYAIKGDALPKQYKVVDKGMQTQALNALLRSMSAEVLALPKGLITSILPPASGHARNRESFTGRANPVFDSLAAAETAASHSLAILLEPRRVARLIQQSALDNQQLSFTALLEALLEATWYQQPSEGLMAEVQRSINWATLKQLSDLAVSQSISSQARAMVTQSLRELLEFVEDERGKSAAQKAMYRQAEQDIKQILSSEQSSTLAEPEPMPPGSPIGGF